MQGPIHQSNKSCIDAYILHDIDLRDTEAQNIELRDIESIEPQYELFTSQKIYNNCKILYICCILLLIAVFVLFFMKA